MAQNSKIEWCKHTVNLWWGCTEVHAGCDNCYARILSNRWGNDVWGNDKPRKLINSAFDDLNKYQELARKAGENHLIFINSMSDIFEKPMPVINSKGDLLSGISDPKIGFIGDRKKDDATLTTGHLRDKLFYMISTNSYPNLTLLLLTKRPSNINKYIPEEWKTNPPVNVMFGTSPVNQETANKLIPQLLQVKGRKFLSVEPQLGAIDLVKLNSDEDGYTDCLSGFTFCNGMNEPAETEKVDWVINGGESGQHKRPFDVSWARKLRDDCKRAGVPFFMKQIDKVQEIPEDLLIREFSHLKVAS